MDEKNLTNGMMRGKRGAGSFSDSPFGELLTVIGSQQQASKL